MINNPGRNIHTDYVANDVFKPKDANALAMSIPFDFVITEELVTNYREAHSYTQANWIDVADLFWDGTGGVPADACSGRKEIHILINFHTTLEDRFDFGSRFSSLGSSSGCDVQEVHIYSLSSYRTTGTTLNIFFHTHGTENYVLFDESGGALYRSRPLHVGSFMLWDNGLGYPQWHNGAPFVYEQCIEGPVPTGGSGEPGVVVKQENWLSNGIGNGSGGGSGSHAIAVLLDFKHILVGPTPSYSNPLYFILTYCPDSGPNEHTLITRTGVGDNVYAKTQRDGELVPRSPFPTYIYNNPGDCLALRDVYGSLLYNHSSKKVVFADSVMGCVLGTNYENGTDSIVLKAGVTQVDVYTTLGYYLEGYPEATFPKGVTRILTIDDILNSVADGQVVELNIHLVELPPAVQNVNADLTVAYMFGEWTTSVWYSNGDIVYQPTDGNVYEWTGGNIGNINNPPPGTGWRLWHHYKNSSSGSADTYHTLYPATPANAEVSLNLEFRANNSQLPIYAWGYGTDGNKVYSTTSAGGVPYRISATFTYPKKYKSSYYNTQGPVSVPIIASSKIIFARCDQEVSGSLSPTILVLNGGYALPNPED